MSLPEITLFNPMRDVFEPFIVGNAQHCDRVVEEGSAKGQRIVICGAGPSLRETAGEWTAKGDQIWGCNSAAIWLHDHGYPITHAFTVDQTPGTVEEWYAAPPLEYLIASSVHPNLVDYLLSQHRVLRFFHNYVGIQKPPVELCACGSDRERCECEEYEPRLMAYERWLYATLYPRTCMAGTALNSVMRAWDVARYMGAEEIVILGADCAIRYDEPPPKGEPVGSPEHYAWLRRHATMHADGSNPLRSGATPVTFEGVIDGRLWITKPDMAITAVIMERTRREVGRKQLRIIGDVLPNALQGKSEAWLDRLPRMGET